MPLLASSRVKKLLITIQLLFFMGNLHATEYSIIDPENLITDEQKKVIQHGQEDILQDQNTLVSYAFYNVNVSKLEMRVEWESSLEKVVKTELSSEKFHLLICVGVFSKQNMVDIFYRNQPALEDVNDLRTCIASLKQSLGGEPDVADLIENSAETIKERLPYLNQRQKYEERESAAAKKTQTEEFIKYIMNLVKIALIIIVPIIAFFIFWYILARLKNRKAHLFPAAPPKKRLEAPYAATSIFQKNN